ncbi:MAG: hypothetical protein K6T30_04040 [Alicyclobacillus sp.]|nr:hypothetical protein [Alicyclobacillus sp.]
MTSQVLSLAIIHVVVAVDNALLAGVMFPREARAFQREVMAVVAVAMALTQIALAAGIDSLLANASFRAAAAAVLVWMSIRTLTQTSPTRGTLTRLRAVWRVYFYTVAGNLDNMIWLGAELKGGHLWLVCFTLVTIPLFMVIACTVSDQCEKHPWILVVGAGMMAWAAASLLIRMEGWMSAFQMVPAWALKAAIAATVLMVGFVVRECVAGVAKRTG